MKTAEEFLKNRGWNENSTGAYDFNGLSNLLESFANAKSKALLEEAAEKDKEDLKLDFKTEWKLTSYSTTRFDGSKDVKWGIQTPFMYQEGYDTPNEAVRHLKERYRGGNYKTNGEPLSLIPKEETK